MPATTTPPPAGQLATTEAAVLRDVHEFALVWAELDDHSPDRGCPCHPDIEAGTPPFGAIVHHMPLEDSAS